MNNVGAVEPDSLCFILNLHKSSVSSVFWFNNEKIFFQKIKFGEGLTVEDKEKLLKVLRKHKPVFQNTLDAKEHRKEFPFQLTFDVDEFWLLRNQNDYLVSVYSYAVSIEEEHELVFSDYQNKKKLRKALANMLKRVEVPEEEELEINDNQEEAVEARDDKSIETEDSSDDEVSSVEFGDGLVDTRKEDYQRVTNLLKKNASPEMREKWEKKHLNLTIKERKEIFLS